MYFHDILSDTKASLKKLWNIFGPIINLSKRNKKQFIEKLGIDNKSISENADIANTLNQYFTTIGNRLSRGMSVKNNHMKYLVESNQSSMFLAPVNQNEINNELGSLKSKKACGSDEITNKIKGLSVFKTPSAK